MAPPKQKPVKMGLGEFLGDQSLGSWADEMEDMPNIRHSGSGYGRRGYGAEAGGGSFGDRDDRFPPRQALPFPDNPPYTAHVGNLSFDVTETQISEFFAACDVDHVRLVRDKMEDRPKGFGYVEFKTKEGLIAAVDLNGAQFSGRNVRISVAEPPKDRGDDRTQGEWRRSGPPPPLDQPPRRGSERLSDRFGEGQDRRHSYNEASDKPPAREPRDFDWAKKTPLPPATPTGSDHGSRPRSGDREFRRRSPAPSEGAPRREYRERTQVERQPTAPERNSAWRSTARADPSVPQVQEPTQKSTPPSPVVPQVRPRLELKPRSGHPIEPGPVSAASTGEPSKSNPFGAARPIDTAQREKEVAEKRAAAIAARKLKEEKAREEKKIRAAAEADKQSEAGTPTSSTRNPSLSGRTSEGAPGGGDEDREDRLKKKEDWSSKATTGSWRAARSEPKEKGPGKEPKVDTGKWSGSGAVEEDDGWTPVSGKRGRGNANGTKNSTAGS